MIPFSKFVELHNEMSSSCSAIEQQLKSVLGYHPDECSGVLVDFGVYNLKEFTINYKDTKTSQILKAVVGKKTTLL